MEKEYLKKRNRKINIAENQISELAFLNLGGYTQQVMLEGKASHFPVVITLHGGPGAPFPFCVGARGLFPEFTQRCILVAWDQYGCGINNQALPEDICIDDFVTMTVDLIKAMRLRFPRSEVYLLGMSWGSVLSAKVAAAHPELVDGVLVYGQVLRQLFRTPRVVQAIETSRAPDKRKEQMRQLASKEMLTYEDTMNVSKCVQKYTDGYQNPGDKKMPLGKLIWGYLTSPDYKWKDKLALLVNETQKAHGLFQQLSSVDLREDLKKVQVPYHILQGDTDLVTDTALITAFVDAAGNDFLKYTVIEHSAHMPGEQGMAAVLKCVRAWNS